MFKILPSWGSMFARVKLKGIPEHDDEFLFGQHLAHIAVVGGRGAVLRVGISCLRSQHADRPPLRHSDPFPPILPGLLRQQCLHLVTIGLRHHFRVLALPVPKERGQSH